MSLPLSSNKDRDPIPPREASSDPRYARRVDVLDELQRALDATRVVATSHQAPPLQPELDEMGGLEGEKAPPPPLLSAYMPPKARRAYQAEAGQIVAQPLQPSPKATSELGSARTHVPEKLGSIAARASTERYRGQQRFEEQPAPDFLRNARPQHNKANPENAHAVPRPLHDGLGGLPKALGGYSDRDDEVLRRILQPQRPAPEDNPDKRGWTALVGFSALASLIVCSLGFIGYQFFSAQPPADSTATNAPRASVVSSSFAKSDDRVPDKNVPKLEPSTPIGTSAAGAKPVKTTMISASQEVFPPPPSPKSPANAPQTNGSRPSSFDNPQRGDNVQVPSSRQLDPDEVHNLIQRGDAALQSGDIAAARLLLRRAAESGDVTAAMALGATYDPGVLTQLGAMGAKGDAGAARDWYQKAADWGSPDAKRRLQELAQQ
jgi:hypothetical protein